MVGPHFAKIQISRINSPSYINSYFEELLENWEKESKNNPSDNAKRNAKRITEFINDELTEHRKRWVRFL
jgi:hypothetical protein